MNEILIIDNDNEWAEDTKDYLESHDYKTIYEPDVSKALEMIKENFYDLILVDYELLNRNKDFENGIKVISKIKDIDKYVPIILVSGQVNKMPDPENIYEDALHLHISDYFNKINPASKLLSQIKPVEKYYTDNIYQTFISWMKNAKDKEQKVFLNSDGEKYSIKDIVNEIRKGSDLGTQFKNNLSNFALETLNIK